MAQFASDAFTNAAGTALPTHNAAWALHASYTGSAVITDVNSARTNTAAGTGALYYHSGAPAAADYSVTADLLFKDANGGNGLSGVVGRVDTAADTYYVSRYDGRTSDRWELIKLVAGTTTVLGSSAEAITDETSHNIKLEMVGSAIKLFKSGEATAAVSVTDTAITAAGKSGIFVYNSANANNASGIQVDNFSADDVAAGVTLVIADIAHAHGLDAVSFTQAHNLAQADIAHGHTLDAVSLTQAHNLVQADIVHAHTLDNAVLNVDVTLSVADVAHAHTLETIALTQTHNLAQADVAHAHVVDAVSVTQAHNLAQADVLHGHTLDNVVLNVDATLAVADISHGHTVDAVTLTQTHNLAQTNVTHGHVVDAASITQAHNLVQADVSHAHTLDAVTLTVGGVTLALDIVLHAHTLDSINLTQTHSLSLVNIAHGHTIDNAIFTFDGVQLSVPRQMYSNSQTSSRSNKQTARRP